MQKKLKKWLLDSIGDVRKQIISVVVLYLLSNAGIGIFRLKGALQMPVPLWAVMGITLFILFGCAMLFLFFSYKNSSNKVKNELVGAEGFKWETTFQNKSVLYVSNIPFCEIHELRLTQFQEKYHCTDGDCNTSIDACNLSTVYKVAYNHIERDIMQK